MHSIIPMIVLALSLNSFANAVATPKPTSAPPAIPANATQLEVTNIDNINDIWGAPNPGRPASRSKDDNTEVTKRQDGTNANSPRLLSCSGVMQIKDDENWPFRDDYFTRTRQFSFILGVNNIYLRTHRWIERAGGEIRIDVLLTATLNPGNGNIHFSHDTKLFEGTTTSSNDLDGRGQGSMNVAKNAQRPMGFVVYNTAEGGDWVKITLVCTNGRLW